MEGVPLGSPPKIRGDELCPQSSSSPTPYHSFYSPLLPLFSTSTLAAFLSLPLIPPPVYPSSLPPSMFCHLSYPSPNPNSSSSSPIHCLLVSSISLSFGFTSSLSSLQNATITMAVMPTCFVTVMSVRVNGMDSSIVMYVYIHDVFVSSAQIYCGIVFGASEGAYMYNVCVRTLAVIRSTI